MIVLLRRNLKLYFRDKGSVFFSLLAVFIIILLYALFLGDVWTRDFEDLDNAQFIMNSWIIAGLLTVASLTTTLGAFGIMIDDRTKKIAKDFYASPLRRRSITGGYVFSAYLVGIIMTLVTLVLGELYILLTGGELISFIALLKVLGLILLVTFANTALMGFMVSFFRSQNAFTTASTIVGTLIGFLTGIYLPIGVLPDAVQVIIKVFPVSHGAALLRQTMLEAPLATAFEGAPVELRENFDLTMGITYQFGDWTVTPLASMAILVATGIVFYALSIFNMARKNG